MIFEIFINELDKKHVVKVGKDSSVNHLGDEIGYLVIDEQGNQIIFADCGSMEENYGSLTKQQVMTSEVIKHEFIEHYWNGYIDYDKQGYIITIKGVDSP